MGKQEREIGKVSLKIQTYVEEALDDGDPPW